MADSRIFIVAGLGNPGNEYAQTRHNIGFSVVDSLLCHHGFPPEKSRFDACYSKGIINGLNVVIIKPQAYMNRSGPPVQKLAAYFKVQISDIIVVHDDLDLAFGRVSIVTNRGHGGHNGIRSIIEALGTKEFIRIRSGVGRPHGERGVTDHVLGSFSPEEKICLESLIVRGRDACVAVMEKGVSAAMNLYNCHTLAGEINNEKAGAVT